MHSQAFVHFLCTTLLMFLAGKLKSPLKQLFFRCRSQAKVVVFFLLLRSVTAELGKQIVITSEEAL